MRKSSLPLCRHSYVVLIARCCYVYHRTMRMHTGMVACGLRLDAIAIACLIWTVPLTSLRAATIRNTYYVHRVLCSMPGSTTGMPRRQLRTDSRQRP